MDDQRETQKTKAKTQYSTNVKHWLCFGSLDQGDHFSLSLIWSWYVQRPPNKKRKKRNLRIFMKDYVQVFQYEWVLNRMRFHSLKHLIKLNDKDCDALVPIQIMLWVERQSWRQFKDTCRDEPLLTCHHLRPAIIAQSACHLTILQMSCSRCMTAFSYLHITNCHWH